MALLRAPHWRRCLQSWPALQRSSISGSAGVSQATPKDPFQDIQDPSKTRAAYSAEDRRVPPAVGTDKEVKWGENIPASGEQAKEEVKHAAKGLAESVEMGVNVLLSKGKDAMAAAQRAVGMESDRPQMSQGTMGAAGKMEYAPPGSKDGGPAASAEHARSKYDEIAGTEKPNFPAGEQSVNELFPDMATAAKEQSNSPEQQRAENEAIRRQLRTPGGSGGDSAVHEPGETSSGMSDNPKDPLSENLHNRGP